MRTMKKPGFLLMAAALVGALTFPALADEKKDDKKGESKMEKTASGLRYEDVVGGTGGAPKHGQVCVMHYTGWLWEKDAKGAKFDSSVDRGKPFKFPLGQGRVIKG